MATKGDKTMKKSIKITLIVIAAALIWIASALVVIIRETESQQTYMTLEEGLIETATTSRFGYFVPVGNECEFSIKTDCPVDITSDIKIFIGSKENEPVYTASGVKTNSTVTTGKLAVGNQDVYISFELEDSDNIQVKENCQVKYTIDIKSQNYTLFKNILFAIIVIIVIPLAIFLFYLFNKSKNYEKGYDERQVKVRGIAYMNALFAAIVSALGLGVLSLILDTYPLSTSDTTFAIIMISFATFAIFADKNDAYLGLRGSRRPLAILFGIAGLLNLVVPAIDFINETAKNYSESSIVISFSGGKDSTVVADLVVRALSNPSLVHIFGDTTLEFPLTYEYEKRFRKQNPKAIIKVAKNKEQDFYKVCEDIGPPARMMRWCCSMFKTGPITRVINNLFKDTQILTFYGIRKHESVSRSKYDRVSSNTEGVKIQKQTVAAPIFDWKDIDVWLYMLTEELDFNDAYRLGYDRVGCWCCPNNNERAQFLSKIYMPDEYKKWHDFLVAFAKRIGKPDPENYVDSGNWKARQGGNGVEAAEDIKIKFTNCTAEENAKIYQLNKPVADSFYSLFNPFGIVSKELGRKMIEKLV